MSKYIKIICCLIVSIVLNIAYLQADAKKQPFKVADIIQSHMVIQQGEPFTVWGKANPGDRIKIIADWLKRPVVVKTDKDGNWSGELDVPTITKGDFTPHQMTIQNKNRTITFNDLLIGEVWLCSGQSNMHMSMQPNLPWHGGALNYQDEIAAANYPHLRLIKVGLANSRVPLDTISGTWEWCSPATVAPFSAVAYFFGRSLLKDLNIPIGLIMSAHGGASCQAWTSREAIVADPILKPYYWDKYENDSTTKYVKIPSLFYNAMIYPIRHFSIKGFLWYQGESNAGDGELYTRMNTAMIKSWRKDFKREKAPFYFVQMAPYNWRNIDPTAYNYALFRTAQENILALENTDMACIMDIGQIDYIHPRNKKPVGERLARLALYHDYGQKDIVRYGPRFSEMKIVKDTVFISFDPKTIGSGLSTNDNRSPDYFFIAGEDRKFFPAHASIVGDKVKLYSAIVKKPVAVRYAFTNYPLTNFCNKEGLPAWPFRTDQWESIKEE